MNFWMQTWTYQPCSEWKWTEVSEGKIHKAAFAFHTAPNRVSTDWWTGLRQLIQSKLISLSHPIATLDRLRVIQYIELLVQKGVAPVRPGLLQQGRRVETPLQGWLNRWTHLDKVDPRDDEGRLGISQLDGHWSACHPGDLDPQGPQTSQCGIP